MSAPVSPCATAIEGSDYWSVTYLDTESPAVAITVGTTAHHAGRFRGSETLRRVTARRSSADPALVARWEGVAWPSASERSFVLAALPPDKAAYVTGKTFFPQLISSPFKHGLAIAFTASLLMCLVAAAASWLRGGRYVHDDAVVAPEVVAGDQSAPRPTGPGRARSRARPGFL